MELCVIGAGIGIGDPTTWKAKFRSLLCDRDDRAVWGRHGRYVPGVVHPDRGAIGAGAGLLVALGRGALTMDILRKSVLETLRTSCMVSDHHCRGDDVWALPRSDELAIGARWGIGGFNLPELVTLAIIMVGFILAGCVIGALALVMLTIPILLPVVEKFTLIGGREPTLIWFGVLVVLITQIGVITPPVGVNVYVVGGLPETFLCRRYSGSVSVFLVDRACFDPSGTVPAIGFVVREDVRTMGM